MIVFFFFVFIAKKKKNLASSAAPMEANSRVLVQVLLLALVVQVSLSQHWSYGWLPGGKRSVGELEATIRMMGTGGVVSLPEEASAQTQERLRPYNVIDDESSHFDQKKRFWGD
ncbi:gonadotropin-releasing hormone 3 [Salarias fasciatus]|nr:progonadoliberin-3 [Salarias fasciatus]